MSITSSGVVPYNVHFANQRYAVKSVTKIDDSHLLLEYFSALEALVPGALVTLHVYPFKDREVQVISNSFSYNPFVTLLGDFSDIDAASIEVSYSSITPVSVDAGMTQLMGFDTRDLKGGTATPILGLQSPFLSGNSNSALIAVTLDMSHFCANGSALKIQNTMTFLDDQTVYVSKSMDDTHIQLTVDRRTLWSTTGTGNVYNIISPSTSIDISSFALDNCSANTIQLNVNTVVDHGFEIDDIVSFNNMTMPEFVGLQTTVVDILSTTSFIVSFLYPSQFSDAISPNILVVNATTANPTTYVTSQRFDMSLGRRVLLIGAQTDTATLGMIEGNVVESKRLFARIQLRAGANAIQFLNEKDIIGSHLFNVPLKRFRSIRLNFYSENGDVYPLFRTDYSMCLKLLVETTSD
jgi:hypothetical protein